MKYELSKPLKLIQGDTITELTIDLESLTLQDLKAAYKVKALFTDSETNRKDESAIISPRLDSNLRIAISWISAIKNDNRITFNDILNLSTKDALCLSEDAIDFLL